MDKLTATREFVAGVLTANPDRMAAALATLDFGGFDVDHAMRAVARLNSVPNEAQDFFLQVHLRFGDKLRQECTRDLWLLRGYRVLMPPYNGSGITLYRGEQADNRQRRTYGMPWTTTRDVADNYARRAQGHVSGGVLLETMAPPEAIICAVPRNSDRYGEHEYLVDRRKLGQVKVLARYPC
jgi:hypothetical protein